MKSLDLTREGEGGREGERGRERDREREFESGGLLSRFVEGYDGMMQEIKFQKK